MGLETGTFINDLNASNPVGASDPKSQGDDHIRLIKSTILATFANITGAVTATHTQLNQLASLAAVSVLGRSANSAGAPAAIAASANDRILRRVSDVVDFGQLTAGMFPGSAIVPDADLSTNIPRLDAENVFTNTGVAVSLSSASPTLRLDDTNAGADEKIWHVQQIDGDFRIRTRTDANGVGNDAVSIQRTGTTVDEIELNATLVEATGSLSCGNKFIHTGMAGSAGARGMQLSGAAPWISLVETGAAANEGLWLIGHDGKQFRIHARNDADSAGTVPFDITRGSGTTIDEVKLDATALNFVGSLTTPNSAADEVGFKGTPHNTQNGNYTLVLSDAGKCIRKSSGGAGETITIPANSSVAFPEGTVIVIHNGGGGDLSIAITSDTLTQLGTGATGTRTLANNGKAILEKFSPTIWKISGIGLS